MHDSILLSHGEPIHIALAGVGGNGSRMLSTLARIDHALQELGRAGLKVDAYDPDVVGVTNVGRQLYFKREVGQFKSVAMVQRVNMAWGTDWEAFAVEYEGQDHRCGVLGGSEFRQSYDMLITCVDSGQARLKIDKAVRAQTWGLKPRYWLDLGNKYDQGQVYLGQMPHTLSPGKTRLPTVLERFPACYEGSDPDDNAPSCSFAESLDRQDLLVNDLVCDWALQLLWRLFRHRQIDCAGYWVNLTAGMTLPIPITLVNQKDDPVDSGADRVMSMSASVERRLRAGAA